MESGQKRILLAEDDQFLREFYQELLTEQGFFIDVASDGEMALEKIWSQDYNLILLDIMMPKKDGLAVLKELKVKPAHSQNLQIVMLTNLGNDAIIKECFNNGAVGYLIKSALNPDQVLVEIKSYLDKSI